MSKLYLLLILSFSIMVGSCSDSNPSGSYDPTSEYNVTAGFKNYESEPGDFTLVITGAKALITNIRMATPGLYDKTIWKGPTIYNFAFDGNKKYLGGGVCDTGVFTHFAFTIHKCDADYNSPDRDFKEGNDPSQRYSLIIDYTVDGTPFRLKYKDDINLMIPISPQVRISADTKLNLAIVFNRLQWFREGGAAYFLPDQPGNYGKIAASIESSMLGVVPE